MIVAVAVILLALLSFNIQYFAITPGPAEDVVKLIDIKGAPTNKVHGHLLLTTVTLHEIRLIEAIAGLFDPNYQVVSRATIVPPGESPKDVEQRTTQQMSESQIFAAAAALRYLGYPVVSDPSGVRVEDVSVDAPAATVLHTGDVIVGADGTVVHQAQEFRTIVKRHKVGDSITLKVVRGTKTIELRTKTIARGPGSSGDPSDAIVGILTTDVPQVHLPLAVKIDSLGIGGPSAGLMFAVGIVDLLNGADIARGRTIAGTGEITVDGHVKAVGGVRQKIAGARRAHAQLFLVPADETNDACAVRKDLPVYAVSTLAEAIKVLTDPKFAATRTCH